MKKPKFFMVGATSIIFMAIELFYLPVAEAQYVYVGGGAHFGMSAGVGCPARIPRGIRRAKDDISRVNKAINELEKMRRDLENKVRDKDKRLNAHKSTINSWFRNSNDENIAKALLDHMELKAPDDVATTQDNCNGNQVKGSMKVPWQKFCSGPTATQTVADDTVYNYHENAKRWSSYVKTGGRVEVTVDGNTICRDINFVHKNNENRVNQSTPASSVIKSPVARCEEALGEYGNLFEELRNEKAELAAVKMSIEEHERELSQLEDRLDSESERYQERLAEGKICTDCGTDTSEMREPTTGDRLAGVLAPLVGGLIGYHGARHIIRNNTEMGWPTSPWLTAGMVAPWAMAGIYGAAYGGLGGLGCSPGYMQGGSAFGYPPGMYNPMAGGAFMPGMMPGMYPAMGFPGAFGAGFGGAFGAGFAGFPAAAFAPGMPMAPYGPMPMAPYGGMPMAPYGGMPMAPYGGMPMAPYGGMPMAPYGGMPMAPYGGMPMAPYGPFALAQGGSNMAMQYQLQMQQMYQQQMMTWMQEQQRMQQDQMQRSQIISRLQQQLVTIQMQIQQISMGAFGTGVGGSSIGGGFNLVPTGNVLNPNDPYSGPARQRGFQIPGN